VAEHQVELVISHREQIVDQTIQRFGSATGPEAESAERELRARCGELLDEWVEYWQQDEPAALHRWVAQQVEDSGTKPTNSEQLVRLATAVSDSLYQQLLCSDPPPAIRAAALNRVAECLRVTITGAFIADRLYHAQRFERARKGFTFIRLAQNELDAIARATEQIRGLSGARLVVAIGYNATDESYVIRSEDGDAPASDEKTAKESVITAAAGLSEITRATAPWQDPKIAALAEALGSTRELLTVPVRSPNGELFASICAVDKTTNQPFTAQDLQATLAMAADTAAVVESVRLAAALRESESRYRALVEGAPIAITTTDLTGVVTYASPKTLELHGYETAEQAIGKNALDMIASQDQERAMLNLQRTLTEGALPNTEYELMRTDGSCFPGELSALLVRDEAGQPASFIATTQDLTRRRKAEAALRAERDRIQMYLDIAGVMLVALNACGEVTLINRRGCQVLECSEGEVIGKNWFDTFLPEQLRQQVKQVFDGLMAAGQLDHSSHESSILTVTGKEKTIRWTNTVVFDEAGKALGTLGSGEDITEHLAAEQALQEYQDRLRSLASELALTQERQRQKVARQVHDEIGPLLALAKMRLTRLQTDDPNVATGDEVEEIHRLLSNAIEQSRSLVTDLASPVLQELGLKPAIEQLVNRLGKEADLHVTLRHRGRAKSLPNELAVVLFHGVRELLINVVKHAQTRNAELSLSWHKDQLRIDVADDGIGWDLSERGSSTGFGLFSIAERLQYVGGRFELNSQPGKGTQATLTATLSDSRTRSPAED